MGQTALPTKMKGMVLTGHGGLDKLEWREDLPVPSPGPEEVVIRVGASSVNNTDINTRIAWYSKGVRSDTASGAAAGFAEAQSTDGSWSGMALSFPRIQGADCCGEIVAVGAAVDRERLGERVLVRPLQTVSTRGDAPETRTFGSECDGAFAEYTKAFSRDALAVRSDWSDVELASFPCAFTTAEGMIQRAGLTAEAVLITGASGGVGLAAVQLAKRRGARVTAVTSPDKAERLRALGADAVLGRDDPLPQQVFDVVIDLVGGPGWPAVIESLRPYGRYAVAGAIAGPMVELDLRTLYLRDLSFFGCTSQPDGLFEDLVRYIEAKEIRPVVAESFALRDLPAAQEAFLSKRHIGKIGVRVREPG